MKIKQSIMSGKAYYGERFSYVSKVLSPILQDVKDDVYVLSGFITYDNEHHRGYEVDYDAFFAEDDYAQLKEMYLDRIAQFQRAGKLVLHPEFFDLFRTWTILLEHEGSDNRMQTFRSVCLSMLRDSVAVAKVLVFFAKDNRLSGSLSDQLEVFIDSGRFEKFWGADKLPILYETLESQQSLDLYSFHALISLRYVVDELKNGRHCDLEQQKAHFLKYVKTDGYWRERKSRVCD